MTERSVELCMYCVCVCVCVCVWYCSNARGPGLYV